MSLNRRAVLSGASALAVIGLAGCNANPRSPVRIAAATPASPSSGGEAEWATEADFTPSSYRAIYGPVQDGKFMVPPIHIDRIDHRFLRHIVDYPTSEAAGTIVVDPHHHFLYHVMGGGRATRYGVGVGRAGFAWSGVAQIHNKQRWPDWYPPQDMFQRQPDLKKLMSHLQGGLGMPGGVGNPLGARAMYLYQNNKDTLYRIHGSNEPESIGKSMSSGCIRMLNQDAMDLYSKTPVGTKVIVLGNVGLG